MFVGYAVVEGEGEKMKWRWARKRVGEWKWPPRQEKVRRKRVVVTWQDEKWEKEQMWSARGGKGKRGRPAMGAEERKKSRRKANADYNKKRREE